MLVIVAGINGASTSESKTGTVAECSNQEAQPVALWGSEGRHIEDRHDSSRIVFTFAAGSEYANTENGGRAGTVDLNILRGKVHIPYADLYSQKESGFWRCFSYIFGPSIACIIGGVFLNEQKKAQLVAMLLGGCSVAIGYHRLFTSNSHVTEEEINKEFPDEFRLANYAQQTEFLKNYSTLTVSEIVPDDQTNIDAMRKNHSILSAAISFMQKDTGQRNESLRNEHIRRNIGYRKGMEGFGLIIGGAASLLTGYLAGKVDITLKK
jgi:hypothetical protein